MSIAEQFNTFLWFAVSWDGGTTWINVPAHFDLEKLRPTHIRVGIIGSGQYCEQPYTAIPRVEELPGIDIRKYQ